MLCVLIMIVVSKQHYTSAITPSVVERNESDRWLGMGETTKHNICRNFLVSREMDATFEGSLLDSQSLQLAACLFATRTRISRGRGKKCFNFFLCCASDVNKRSTTTHFREASVIQRNFFAIYYRTTSMECREMEWVQYLQPPHNNSPEMSVHIHKPLSGREKNLPKGSKHRKVLLAYRNFTFHPAVIVSDSKEQHCRLSIRESFFLFPPQPNP